MLKAAVVGLGNIGNIHASVYASDELANFVAVCDIIPERADKAASKHGVRAYYSVDDMLQNEELDAVSVATAGTENGGDHYEPVMQCLDAGLHVLCEKPISNDIVKARAMAAKADEKGLYFGINLNHRFVPPAAKAKEWVDEGKLGDLLLINMTMWISNPNDSSPWFHLRPLASAFARHHALLLRRCDTRARLRQPCTGPRLLLQRPGQPGVRQRRRRAPHRQL